MATMITDKARKNLENMLYHPKDIINRYLSESIAYSTLNWGNVLPPIAAAAQKQYIEHAFEEYESQLENCITTFEREIKKNIIEFPSEKVNPYVSGIVNELVNFIQGGQHLTIEDIRLHNIQIKLLSPFIDKVKKEFEQGERKFGFRLPPTTKTDEKKAIECLKDNNFVSKKTSQTLLRNILYSKEEINKKVDWMRSIPSLHDFIDNLWQPHGRKHGKWKAGENCFTFNGKNVDADTLHNTRGVGKEDKIIVNEVLNALGITASREKQGNNNERTRNTRGERSRTTEARLPRIHRGKLGAGYNGTGTLF